MIKLEDKVKTFENEFHAFKAKYHFVDPRIRKRRNDVFDIKLDTDKIQEELANLSSLYPHGIPEWDKALDAYLAWDSAMMLWCKGYGETNSKITINLLQEILETGDSILFYVMVYREYPVKRILKYLSNAEKECNDMCETISNRRRRCAREKLTEDEKKSVNCVMRAIRKALKLKE